MEIRISTKSIFRAVKWVAAIAGVVLAALLAINARDEAPNPGIAALVADTRPPVPDAENAFFTLLAFDAPLETDAHAAGMAWAAQRAAAIKDDPYVNEMPHASFQLDPKYGFRILQDMGMDNLVCNVNSDCSRGRTTDDYILLSYIDKNDAELKRYESLYAFPHYRITHAPIKVLRGIGVDMEGFRVGKMHQLEMAKVALALRKKKVDDALDILARDTRFWRMVLAETDDTQTKRDAATMVTENMHFLGDIIPMGNFGKQGEAAIDAILQPLSAAELDLRPVIRRDFMTYQNFDEGIAHGKQWRKIRSFYLWNLMRTMEVPKDGSWVESVDDVYYKFFYQPNATVNRNYLRAADGLALSALSAKEYATRIHASGCTPMMATFQQGACETKIFGEEKKSVFGDLYNRPARYLNTVNRISYVLQLTALHNLQGYVRLLTLQFKAKQGKIAEQDIGSFLANAGADLTDPYTGKPMQYDSSQHQLYFMAMGASLMQDSRFWVSL